MLHKTMLVWWCIVIAEIICIGYIGYRYVDKKRQYLPKNLHVMPIDSESLQFPGNTGLKFYSEPKANIQKQEDLSLLGMNNVIVHTFNADGLNERFDYSMEKGANVLRVVSLGDSFTEGAFVETKNNYSELLEDMLNRTLRCPAIDRIEVINLGVEGYDMQYTLERYKRKGVKYNPDLIILWTHENDYVESNEKLGDLFAVYNPFIEAPETVRKYKERGDYYPAQSVLIEEYFRRHSRNDLINEELMYLDELIALYKGPIIIFALERFPADIRTSIEHAYESVPRVRLYASIPETYGAFPDQHPSIEGHKEFAKFLYQKIVTTLLSSCEKR